MCSLMDFLKNIPSFFSFGSPSLSQKDISMILTESAQIRSKVAKIGQDYPSIEDMAACDMNRIWNETIEHLSEAQDEVLNEDGEQKTNC